MEKLSHLHRGDRTSLEILALFPHMRLTLLLSSAVLALGFVPHPGRIPREAQLFSERSPTITARTSRIGANARRFERISPLGSMADAVAASGYEVEAGMAPTEVALIVGVFGVLAAAAAFAYANTIYNGKPPDMLS